jgi:hypothetical protein
MTRYIVRHTETLVVVGRFADLESAKYWLEQLGVTREYKDRCYRIEKVAAQ